MLMDSRPICTGCMHQPIQPMTTHQCTYNSNSTWIVYACDIPSQQPPSSAKQLSYFTFPLPVLACNVTQCTSNSTHVNTIHSQHHLCSKSFTLPCPKNPSPQVGFALLELTCIEDFTWFVVDSLFIVLIITSNFPSINSPTAPFESNNSARSEIQHHSRHFCSLKYTHSSAGFLYCLIYEMITSLALKDNWIRTFDHGIDLT